MRFSRIIFLLASVGLLMQINLSCRKSDKIDARPGLQLAFSTDTVFFDTVFPTIGSITQRLIVHNTNKNKVSISSIRLAGGQSSSYRINVNGIPAVSAADVEIAGGDSLYIFVRVTIDPNNANTPFVVSDSIEFITNGSLQNVKLVAWGRNAIFYRKASLKGTVTWDSLRAHVIFESLRLDTNSTLIIMPGTRVYFHKDATMAVSYRSTLKILGTIEQPVRFQGDRMDTYYKDLPGQWGGIHLEQGSRDHEFNHTIIKNGTYGLWIDSLGNPGSHMLTIKNSIIQNMTSIGLYAYGSDIYSENCVIGDCGGSSLYIEYGGSYDFRQLTVGNYWYTSVRHAPAIYLSNYYSDTLGQKRSNALSKCYFGNVILYGSNDEEIGLDSVSSMQFVYTFDHAMLKTKLKTTNPSRYINCMVNKNPRFVDVSKLDYRIDSISPAIGYGSTSVGIQFDILGNDRGNAPDLGAYQYVKKN
jgi:hypothetical protein